MEREFLIARIIARLLPLQLHPDGFKLVDGKKVALSDIDRRDQTQRAINWRINKLLDQYSPWRRYHTFIEKKQHSANLSKLREEVGKVALLHFAIESGLRETLLNDWDVSRSFVEKVAGSEGHSPLETKTIKVDKLFGQHLRKRFLKEMKNRGLPPRFLDSYKALDREFGNLTDRRNEIVKAVYVVDRDFFGTYRPVTTEERMLALDNDVPTEDFLANSRKWMGITPFSLGEIEELYADLRNLNGRYMQLRSEVWKDKLQLHPKIFPVGVVMPWAAMNNPYLFFKEDE